MVTSESENPQEEGDGAIRLTIHEQCQIMAALRWRSAPQFYTFGKRKNKPMARRRWQAKTIARLFGVSAHAVSQINNCLTTIAFPKRYQKVASEWRELGEAEFMRVYYTSELREKLILATKERQ